MRQERRSFEAPKWVFAVSEVKENELYASGLFTLSCAGGFFSRRAIASFRGRLLRIRDIFMPGKRIDKIRVFVAGTDPVELSFDTLERDYITKVIFKAHSLYGICLLHAEAMEQ